GGTAPAYGADGKLEPMAQAEKIFVHPHDVCVDRDENVYVAQWASGKVYPYKFIRVYYTASESETSMRRRIMGISRQALFALNVLIVFFLVFEPYLQLPAWLQVLGRMHPMFLHFPIVILLLAVALDIFLPADKDGYRKILLDA